MRRFIACPVPATPAFTKVTRDLDCRPVPVGSWHVTLQFLGDLELPAAKEALHAAAGPAMDCTVQGVGAFRNPEEAYVAWAKIKADGLAARAAAVRKVVPGGKPFVPHVTLGRYPNPRNIRHIIEQHQETLLSKGQLTEAVLFQSKSTPRGTVHERLEAIPFQ